MILLSVDLGKARTGLAVCDKNMILASPLCVISEYNRENLLRSVAEKAGEVKAEQIIVGLPKNMDGSEGESALSAKEFAHSLQEIVSIPVMLFDERCTTMVAHRYMNETNVRGLKRKKNIDAVAATIILQNYIDFLKNKRDI